VLLSVPSVDIMPRDAAARQLATLASQHATGITQNFDGALVGLAALVFPEEKSLHIVRAVLRGSYPLDEVTELAQETLMEIGNIILNACLGTISNFARTEITSSLPSLTSDIARDLFSCPQEGGESQSITLFLHIRFQVNSDDISGFLVFVMDMVGVERFRGLVSACLHAMEGGR